MRQLARLIKRFSADERGVFAVIFGVMAIVLVATAGAVVDFVTLQQARNRAQVALDAAALALQPRVFERNYDEEAIREDAEALVIERIADNRISAAVDVIDTDPDEGSLYLEAALDVPTYFVALVGVPELRARLASEATRKKLAVEVAMVLDNSGSMASGNRLASLKGAATCATNILFLGSCVTGGSVTPSTDVKVGIVPFTSLVNVGAGYANASWIDRTGQAPKSNDNFDDDDDETTPFDDNDPATAMPGGVDRVGLFDRLSNVSWKGCMEARVYPHSVSDTEPTSSRPETLFTPAFAPDEPDGGGFSNNYLSDFEGTCPVRTCTRRTEYTNCTYSRRTGWQCMGPTNTNYTITSGSTTSTSSLSCIPNPSIRLAGPAWSRSGSSIYEESVFSLLSERERQERLCKYAGWVSGTNNYLRGPNAGCPDATVLPLSDQRDDVIQAIAAMRSEGGTNIHQGAIWGFHVLSPTEPFTEGNPYREATSKVMILMTDGENTFYTANNMNNASFNQAYGLPYNQREGDMSSTDASMAARMNALLLETCANSKDAGITVYTVGLEPPNQTTIDVLTDCATGPTYAHFPQSASDLNEVFATIAEELAQLRLAQ